MQDITDRLTYKFEPVSAIIIYQCSHSYVKYYLESREILNGKMGAGVPLTEDCIKDMVNFFHQNKKSIHQISGPVPENLLYCNYGFTKRAIMWYRAPEERTMFFSPELHIKNGKAMQPGLIYTVINNTLSVHAYTGNTRPQSEDIIYHAPYHNVSVDGNVCLGSAKIAKPKNFTYESFIHYWETLFWGSEFSHLAGNRSPINGNLNVYWKNLIKTGKEFDNAVLLPLSAGDKNMPVKFINLLNYCSR